MDSPTFPLIYAANDGHISFIWEPKDIAQMQATDFINKTFEHGGFMYDNAGQKWTFTISAKKFKNTGLSRFLAKTVYNPAVEVDLHWKQAGTFEMSEIKEKVIEFVKKDKGVVTQMVGLNLVLTVVEGLPTLGEIVNYFKDYIFNVSMQDWGREIMRNNDRNRRSRI